MSDDVAVIDGNHPLAGQTLEFDIELLEIRDGGVGRSGPPAAAAGLPAGRWLRP
ncbi:MAG: hypothetical protein R3D98_00640 [Candidatus Krumholzibacteriia bacterium]